MADKSHEIFKRIVLHNKLLSEVQVDALLRDEPDPQRAVQSLVAAQVWPAKTATKFLELYGKQIDKLTADPHGGPSPAEASDIHAVSLAPHEGPAGPAAAAPPPPAPAGKQPRVAPHAATAPATAPPQAKAPRHVEAVPSQPIPVPQCSPGETAGKGLIHHLLRAARNAGASDLHLKSGAAPLVRLAGRLRSLDAPPLAAELCESALLDVLESDQRRKFDESHDLDFCYDGGAELGRFRANYLSQHRGMDAVFRLIPARVPHFDELDLPEQVQKFTDYRVGIVLVTGPKGCGKTTTLAAMIDLINTTRAEHIITLEDPIEFVHPSKKGHVNQREVGRHTESFSNALRAALREAPDVIMVGEMRDLETTSLAVTAAETGHLVLATLHTPNAVRTIGRVLDVFPAKEQGQVRAMLSESLRGIVSQLLVPGADGKSMHLAVEILVNNSAIGNLIREDRTFQLPGIMQTGKRQGMQLMDDSLLRLARDGRISKEEALARAEDAPYLERELK